MKLRSYLILLVIAAVLPVVIFAAVMTYYRTGSNGRILPTA